MGRLVQTQNEKQNKQTTRSASVNIWKVAFLLLLGILVGTIAWVSIQLFSPTETEREAESPSTEEYATDNILLEVRSEKKQIELLANQYLSNEIDNGQLSYELYLKEVAQLIGELDIFGIPVPFELDLDPYVMEGGNLQLKATSLSLGNLNLPISFVMKQMEKQLKLPEWVTIHADSKYLIVHFDEFSLKSGVHFSMEYINLSEDDIRVNVFVPNEF